MSNRYRIKGQWLHGLGTLCKRKVGTLLFWDSINYSSQEGPKKLIIIEQL